MGITNFPHSVIAAAPEASIRSAESGSPIQQPSFLAFALERYANRKYLFFTLAGSIIQLIIFKLSYPYPDFMSDSYDYIQSATYHLNVNLWPIGYAKFLMLVHSISYSDTLLVAIQYVLIQTSLLIFFYTVNYLYRPSRITQNILFVFIFFNPVSLYISNCVLSDTLFGGITIAWFSILLWQLRSPTSAGLLAQVVLIGLAFTIRYTAIYYPFVAVLAMLISPIPWRTKIPYMVAPFILFFLFVRFTQLQTKAITNTAEFSVFGGWQIANNALYMYRYIQVDSNTLPPETRKLDQMVKQYFKWAPPGYINLADFDGTFFIKHSDAPLKQYMAQHYYKQQDTSLFLAWGKVSPIYNKYGNWLISHYPLAFAQHYLWLNAKNYFVPFLAQMAIYNMKKDTVWSPAQIWFHYPTNRVRSISKTFQEKLFFSYPPIFFLLNLYYAGCLLWLCFSKRFRLLNPAFQQASLLVSGYIAINFGFSVFATPVVLRYELVPMLLLFTFSTLLLEFSDPKSLNNA